MILSLSRMPYLQFFPSHTLEHFMTGHLKVFHLFQGVPRKIRFDNLLSVVLKRFRSATQFNPRFLAFAAFLDEFGRGGGDGTVGHGP